MGDNGTERAHVGIRQRVDTWWEENHFYFYLVVLLLALAVAFLWERVVITVPSGHHGVMFRRFDGGTQIDQIWAEGQHIVPPWDTLYIYETRVQEKTNTFPVLTRDGLEVGMTISVRYYPIVGNLGLLHKDLGPDYFQRVIWPKVESNLRLIIGDRTAYELYSTEGDLLQDAKQLNLTVKSAATRYMRIDEVLIRRIQLPEIVRQAINEKHMQEQILLGYEFRVKREEKEAERKRIEASGIRDFNSIAGDISEQLLRWRGVDATLSLAQSPNSKVIVIGGGNQGLPIILDTTSDSQEPAGAKAGRDATGSNPGTIPLPSAEIPPGPLRTPTPLPVPAPAPAPATAPAGATAPTTPP